LDNLFASDGNDVEAGEVEIIANVAENVLGAAAMHEHPHERIGTPDGLLRRRGLMDRSVCSSASANL
jgi:hypothetical protein